MSADPVGTCGEKKGVGEWGEDARARERERVGAVMLIALSLSAVLGLF
jgi:hypothetical protein